MQRENHAMAGCMVFLCTFQANDELFVFYGGRPAEPFPGGPGGNCPNWERERC